MIVTPDFPLWDGGISTLSYELSRALNQSEVSTVVVAPRQTPEDLSFDASLTFTVIRLANPKAKLVAPIYQTLRLLPLVLHYRPRAIIATCWYPCGLALVNLKHFINGSLNIMVHGSELIRDKFRSPFWQRRMYLGLKAADMLVAVSGHVKAMLVNLGLPAEKIGVIGNGVNPANFRSPDSLDFVKHKYHLGNERIILTVARLVARKGHDVVLRALPRVLEVVPDTKYIIVGKGNYEGQLRAMARRLKLEGNVIFAGFVPMRELAAYYHLSDVFVMPSRTEVDSGDLEGFGISFLEANVCGKPVVAGRSGGVEDAVINGKTGLLVDPRNEQEVAQALIRLLTNRRLAKKLGQQGQDRVFYNFTWNRIAKIYIEKLGLES